MNNKVLWAVIIVAVLVVGWIFFRGGDNLLGPVTGTASPTVSPGTVPRTGTGAGSGGVIPGGTPVAQNLQNYSELVNQYAGRRVEFDEGCQMRPADVTFKNGTVVMFDNRSGDARTITIDGIKYIFPGYGYRLMTLSNPTLPHTANLSCGSAVNVGSVLIQK